MAEKGCCLCYIQDQGNVYNEQNQQVNWSPARKETWKRQQEQFNCLIYFDNKMMQEEEMKKQLDDDRYDDFAYGEGEDDLCA